MEIKRYNNIVICNNEVYFQGIKIPDPPCKVTNTTIINDKIFINGYEYIAERGIWKRSLRALFHKWF